MLPVCFMHSSLRAAISRRGTESLPLLRAHTISSYWVFKNLDHSDSIWTRATDIVPKLAAHPAVAHRWEAPLIFCTLPVGLVGSSVVRVSETSTRLGPISRTSNVVFSTHVWYENGAGPQYVSFALDGSEDIAYRTDHSAVYLQRRQHWQHTLPEIGAYVPT